MFKFSLEEVLQHKKRIEDEKQRKFAKAKAELYKIVHQLDELKKEKSHQMYEWGLEIRKEPNLNLFELYDNYIQDLNDKIIHKKNDMRKVNQEFTKAHQELLLAMKNREVIDELKKRERQEYNEKIKKEEQKVLSEIGIISFNRR